MHKNFARNFCGGFKTPHFRAKFLAHENRWFSVQKAKLSCILKIRLSKQVSEQTPHAQKQSFWHTRNTLRFSVL